MNYKRFRNYAKNKGKAREADKKVETIAGKVFWELEKSYHQMPLRKKLISAKSFLLA
ncbi:MAG: hypothetical protein ACOH2A_08750 [Sphingobacteriaceae bacterium]